MNTTRTGLAATLTALPLAALLALPSASAIAAVPTSVLALSASRHTVAPHLSTGHATAAKKASRKTVKKAAVKKAAVKKAAVKAVRKATPATPVTPGAAPVTTAAARPVAKPTVTSVSLTSFEARMVTLVNQARVADGEHPLTVTAGTTDVARRWALQLASDDALSHNPNIVDDLQSAGSPDWTFIAENVGTGPVGDADNLFAAYMNSPHHRDNILDPRAAEIGMAAVAAPEPEGDAEWNVMDFVDSYTTSYGAAQTNAVGVEQPLSQLTASVLG